MKLNVRFCALAFTIVLLPIGLKAQLPTSVPVTVTNTTANPIPTKATGTTVVAGTVQVTNTPTVQVSSMPPVSIGNIPSVTVAGTVNTKSVDEPGRTPYLAKQAFGLTCQPTTFEEMRRGRQCNATFPAVPAGKRLVIQQVSGDLIIDSFVGADPLLVTGIVQGQTAQTAHFVTVAFFTHATDLTASFFHEIYRFKEAVVTYVDPGDAPQVAVLYDTDRLAANLLGGSVTISGYVVDTP
jgi:hypothetical protein